MRNLSVLLYTFKDLVLGKTVPICDVRQANALNCHTKVNAQFVN